jgi:hypothetical protein
VCTSENQDSNFHCSTGLMNTMTTITNAQKVQAMWFGAYDFTSFIHSEHLSWPNCSLYWTICKCFLWIKSWL